MYIIVNRPFKKKLNVFITRKLNFLDTFLFIVLNQMRQFSFPYFMKNFLILLFKELE